MDFECHTLKVLAGPTLHFYLVLARRIVWYSCSLCDPTPKSLKMQSYKSLRGPHALIL